jgi:hypothetical protein
MGLGSSSGLSLRLDSNSNLNLNLNLNFLLNQKTKRFDPLTLTLSPAKPVERGQSNRCHLGKWNVGQFEI